MLPLLALLAASVSTPCHFLAGADDFAWHTRARWIILGESAHGTVEQPQAAIDVLCAFMRANRPIIVAIEHARVEQEGIDAYLGSDGSTGARAALFRGWNWNPAVQDGKASQAMLALFEWLRREHRAGKIKGVIAFDGWMTKDDADRNDQMAAILEAAKPGPRGVVIALTGSAHARKMVFHESGVTFAPPAVLLPRSRTTSILIRGNGGTAWGCGDQGCHAYPLDDVRHARRGLTMGPSADAGGFDGVLELGTLETASPPANSIAHDMPD